MNQLSLFAVPAIEGVAEFVAELHGAIAEGCSNADLIPWADRNAAGAIAAMRSALEAEGWIWNPSLKQLERAGWLVWFRSQGDLSSPIAQWSRL